MEDICQAVHLKRSSAYYQFKNKEEFLLRVLQNRILENERRAEQYCPVKEYWYTLSMTILWEQYLTDEKIHRMILQWIRDNPEYSSDYYLFPVHTLCYQPFTDKKLCDEDIHELSASSAYGLVVYITSLRVGNHQIGGHGVKSPRDALYRGVEAFLINAQILTNCHTAHLLNL